MTNILSTSQIPVSTYPIINAVLGITLAHKEPWDWFYNKFVQIYGNLEPHAAHICNFIDGGSSTCPFLKVYSYSGRFIHDYFDSIIDFVIYNINMGDYVYLYFDRYYIEASEDYQRSHFPHMLLITGYDLKKKIVFGSDFFNRIYSRVEISFQNIENSYFYYYKTGRIAESQYLDVSTIHYWEDMKWDFNLEMLISALEEYISGVDSTGTYYYHIPFEQHNSTRYGLNCYDVLKFHALEDRYDIRSYQVIYAHKKIMNMRLKFLEQQYGIDLSDIRSHYKCFERTALIIRNMVLKQEINDVQNFHIKVISRLAAMRNEEHDVVLRLIDNLKTLGHG